MQASRSVVVAIALAAFWSPFAAAACARARLMDPPPFAARAEPGSSAAITTHKTKRMTYLRCGSPLTRESYLGCSPDADSSKRYVGFEPTQRLMNSPACASASRPSVSFAFHIGQAWIMLGHTCNRSEERRVGKG